MTMPVIVVLLGPLCDPGFVSDQDTHGLAVPDARPDRWPRAARPFARVDGTSIVVRSAPEW